MATLQIELVNRGQVLRSLILSADMTVETTLTVSGDYASLPTLISVENIIGEINNAGFELVNEKEVNKIAELINTYYLPTARELWTNISLKLNIAPIPPKNKELYQEIARVRNTILHTAYRVAHYDEQNDSAGSKQVQDEAIMTIARLAKQKPDWWERLPRFLVKTTIPILFDKIIGIPLATLVKSILGQFFDNKYI